VAVGVPDMPDRYARQRGLVDQDKVKGLKIATSGLPDSLNEAMLLLSEQLGIDEFPCSNQVADYSIQAADLIENECNSMIPISFGSDGVFLDGRVSKKPIHAIYEPAVATIAACLVLNEVLRRAGAFLPVEVPKVSVSVNVRVDENSMSGPLQDVSMSIAGHSVSSNIRPAADGSGHRRVMLRLSDDDPIAVELRNRLVISGGRDDSNPKQPFIEFEIEDPANPPEGHVTIVGAGGLGTWVLKTMVDGISNVKSGKLEMLVFDGDMEVERHNLNRQVIFTEADIGKPKVEAANDWLHNNLPCAEIKIAYELGDWHLNCVQSEDNLDDEGIDLDELLEHDEQIKEVKVVDDEEVRNLLKKTDVILGCLDAMRPRTLADLASARLGQPYVNAGVQGLEAMYREYTDTSLVSVFGPQIATNKTIFSCQEDGEVPVASIVLTNALVASFQSIAALQRLSGFSSASVASVYWRLRRNEISCLPRDGQVSREQYVTDIESALWPRLSKDEVASSNQSLEAEV
jgi:molybdopterin/thiamine biosynthesis adenylyltransferase